MFTHFHPHSVVLIIAIICLMLLPVINCTSDQSRGIAIEKQSRPSTIENHFYDLFRQGRLNRNFDEEQQFNELIEHYLKHYPHRRALAFHAMRGKRTVKTA